MRMIAICLSLAALALAGCQTDGSQPGLQRPVSKPKTVVVTDFVYSPDVTIIDRGFTVRLSRKEGNDLPFHIRKERTLARVNDEIVATIVATVRAAGLDAAPGSADSVSLKDDAVIVGGRLRPGEGADKRSRVPASATAARASSPTCRWSELAASARSNSRPSPRSRSAKAKVDAAAIAAALPADSAAAGRLSPDVEAQTHALGRAIGDRIVAYARGAGLVQGRAAGGEPEKKRREDGVGFRDPRGSSCGRMVAPQGDGLRYARDFDGVHRGRPRSARASKDL